MRVNLKWWFLFCLSILGVGFCGATGLLTKLWEIDVTKLSFLCIVFYFFISPYIGYLTHQIRKNRPHQTYDMNNAKEHAEQYIEPLEFSSEVMMRVAIMGTALGYFFMLAPFDGGMLTLQMVTAAAKGLATIMLVTFVGILCSTGIVLQILCLKQEIKE